MRRFQNLIQDLKVMSDNSKPGHPLVPPSSLRFVENDGRKIYYATMGLDDNEVGARFPVVLVHGFGGFFMDWPRVMAPLSRHTRVYALDLPGWGFSDPNLGATAMEDDVRAVEAFIEKLELKNVILCGLSYGGGIAWAAAAMRARNVREVVLLNPMPTYPLDFMKSLIYQGIFLMALNERIGKILHSLLPKSQYKMICKESLLNFRLLDSFYLDLAYKVTKQPKLSFVLHMQAKGAREVNWADWEHRLAGIRIPVTILQGKQDRLFSIASAKHLQSLIPGSKLIEVDNCGHAMVFDQHRKVSDFLISRLNGKVEQDESRSG